MVHGSNHPDISLWLLLQAGLIRIGALFQISIPAALTNYTLLPTSSALTRVQLPFSDSLAPFTGSAP